MPKWKKYIGETKKQRLPAFPAYGGIYAITDQDNNVCYIGMRKRLNQRASQLFNHNPFVEIRSGFSHVRAKKLSDSQAAGGQFFIRFIESAEPRKLEAKLIREFEPLWPTDGGTS